MIFKPDQFPQKHENPIKEGVDFVFEKNPKLAQIGTKEQYSEYLDTIFNESKLKDIFYHGAIRKFEEFDLEKGGLSGRNFGKGIYASPNVYLAKDYALGENGNVMFLMLDIKNPFITCNDYKDWHGAHYPIPYHEKFTKYVDKDSIINYEYLDRDLLKKINDYMIEYIGETDEKGFPVYQKNIRTNPKIRELVIPEVSQVHILGSDKDLEGFKNFTENKK